MANGIRYHWLLGLALSALLILGCAGVLVEESYDDGHTERLRVQGGDRWSKYDKNPIKDDATSIMLKKETTF